MLQPQAVGILGIASPAAQFGILGTELGAANSQNDYYGCATCILRIAVDSSMCAVVVYRIL